MLNFVKSESLDNLMEESLPKSIFLDEKAVQNQQEVLGEPISEYSALLQMKNIAEKNEIFKNYIGQGYNPVITPPVILRNVLENPAWYTSYTPYQAEISQGRLESLLNFQTLITELTGLPFSNASLLDEATSAAEAMYMAFSLHGGKKKDFFVSAETFPFIKDTIKARGHYLGINIIEGDPNDESLLAKHNFFGALVQNPDNLGRVCDFSKFASKMKEINATSIMTVDILSLLLCKSPGEMGFDIAVGSAQRFGVPMMNGGPHAGFIATRDEFKRKIPGRVVGISRDRHGNPAYRLSLQTREQHIRRDKATSNICTAQALLANTSAFYSIFHGKQGLINISKRINLYALFIYDYLNSIGFSLLNSRSELFDTISIDLTKSGTDYFCVMGMFEEREINVRLVNKNIISITLNETTTLTDLEEIINTLNIFKKIQNEYKITDNSLDAYNESTIALSPNLRRDTTNILNQDIFNKYSSEHQILRYIYYLQSKDISLCNSMISLGSCTMKLNSTSEMVINIFNLDTCNLERIYRNTSFF
jgi:glycine dehydrogenase